jgi:hypothetical protein
LLGNYQVEWAHGLALWSAYGSTISSNVHVAGRRWGRELRPYLAASETSAHFGAAVLRAWSNFEFLAFASSKKRDVRLQDGRAPVGYRTTGYHRLPSEILQRGNLHESAWGGALKYRFQADNEIGVLYYFSRYDRAWQIEDAGVHHFDFTGRENGVFSLMARGRWAGLWLGFEAAHSRSGGNAGSLVMSGDEGALRWTAALYRFEVDFHSPRGRSLHGTDETAQAEAGYSLGLSLKLRPDLVAESYYRRARSLWPTALLPFPPDQREFGFSSKWQMTRRLSLYLRYRNSANERLTPADEFGVLRYQLPEHIEKIRLELVHRLGAKTYLRPRLDWARQQRSDFRISLPASDSLPSIRRSPTHGLALAVDFSWQILRNLAVSVQHAVFDSEIPLYYYERDLPGVFTVRAVRGQGLRRYIYVHLKVLPNLSVACKVATTEQESSAFQRQQNFSWALQLDWGR